MNNYPVHDVIAYFGGRKQVASITGVTYMAVKKWEECGFFPRTEYTSETNHTEKLVKASNGRFKKDDLLPPYTTQQKTPSSN